MFYESFSGIKGGECVNCLWFIIVLFVIQVSLLKMDRKTPGSD
jgi:hypothetical protein